MTDDRSPRERVLAVDPGERRIGLAISNPDFDFVSGLPTIDRSRLEGSVIAALARIVEEEGVDRIVVGIPYTLAGEEGEQARRAREIQNRLTVELDVPVEEWDERLTTEAAKRALRETGHSERDMKDKLDQLAAVLMLEGYLRRASG